MTSMEFPIPLIEKERYPRFFFGQLKKVKGHLFCVRDVVTPGFISRYKSEFRLPSSTSDELMYKEMIDNWVVGLKGRYGPVLFEDKGLLAPVQVISWNYFEYRSVEPGAMRFLSDAIKYLSDTSTLEIHARDSLPLIGGKESIIIYDEVSNVFLKGFSYVGERKISCTNVSFLPSDDFLKVEEQNQASPITFGDACQFLLLVPETDNEYAKDKKHSVLDWRGWQSLDKYKLSVQKTEKLPSVEKDEDSVGERGAKWGQNEEEESDSRPAPAKPTISLPVSREISIRGAVVVKDLALKLGVRPNRLVADLMHLKIDASVNQRIEPEAAIKVAQKYGYKVNVEYARDAVNKKPVQKSIDADDEISQGKLEDVQSRPQGGTFRGHVDHGKTATTQEANDVASVMSSVPTTGETTEKKEAVTEPNVTTKKEAMIEEKEFLERFIGFVRECGYQYELRDLIRFHTCAKCGFFTLLGGESGTGKSSLALLYAKAIAGNAYKDREQLLRVDVNPGWMEPADLMGYYSSSANVFLESEVGLVSFLEKAEEAAGPRMVCFEEMNLAYVEHYFSDFIQQMSRAKGDRAVAIKKGREECESISLNDNLRFFGTINFDETTKELSARFYDRCNYIELSPASKTFPRLHSPVKNDILCEGDEIPSKVFNEWVDNAWEGKIDGWIMDLLDKVYPTLQSLHIAPNWRKACDIYRYIASRPPFRAVESKNNDEAVRLQEYSESEKEIFNREVLDEVIVQSIIPVYRRPNEFLEKAQDDLLKSLEDNKLELSKNMVARILGIETPYQDET